MDIKIRKTNISDLDSLMPIFDEARATIATLGIDQWQNGYPEREVIINDISHSQSYLVELGGEIIATFALILDGEPDYDHIFDGEWQSGDKNKSYIAMHRVAISVKCRGKGVSTSIVNYAVERAKALGFKSLRIDTHKGNIVMRKMLSKHNFLHCGSIFLKSGAHRVAYERMV